MKLVSIALFILSILISTVYALLHYMFCMRRSDGMYGELYGPVVYFKPYIISVSIGLLLLSFLMLIILALRHK
jgi:hypothetical protein